ncbi:MAG: Gfo/Idh/MocA family protein [Pyrinomonadaceae bacterium]
MSSRATAEARSGKPRLGFLGTGWIGRNRLEAVVDASVADTVAVSDPSEENATAARALAPDAELQPDVQALLQMGLDGLVIATPSALHAEQACAALDAGIPVFCQKPLGRNTREVRKVVNAAKRRDLLLMVDLSYRYIDGVKAIRELVQGGALGEIFAADLKFHNAYGPDKPWFFDRKLSGGGCLIDLGVHLVDLLLWTLDFPAVYEVSGHLRAKGKRLDDKSKQVEDYACGEFQAGDCLVQLACSWNLNAGRDAQIEASIYGTKGGAKLSNVGGSFFDFQAERFEGTSRGLLTESGNDADWTWGGRAVVDWATRLAAGDTSFDKEAERFITVSKVLDQMYGR